MLYVTDYILECLDHGRVCMLAFLDQSSAFDLVPHCDLLQVLCKEYGFNGVVIDWFKSYLCNRSQPVVISGFESTCGGQPSTCGVPQGSILGPKLFSCYSAALGDMIGGFGLKYVMYADDIQVMTVADPKDVDDCNSACGKLLDCIASVRNWMISRGLKLNVDKTEFLVTGSKHNLELVNSYMLPINFSNSQIRDLGVILDPMLSLCGQVNHLCKVGFYNLFNINRIRRFLSADICKQLVHALVIVHLDQCNSLLLGLPMCLLNRLQRLQNAAARCIAQVGRRTHITPVLKDLHWLPVVFRIHFKVLCIVFNCLHGTGPEILSDKLFYYCNPVALRSNFKHLLTRPLSFSHYGDRCFSVCAPRLWNDLPHGLRCVQDFKTFKRTLKTYLFNLAFN